MNCRNMKKHFVAIMDGAEVKDGAFLAHAAKCKKCAKELKVIQKMNNAFSLNERVKVKRDFNAGVWAKIGEPAPSLLGKLFLQPANYAKAAAIAAAVMLLVFISKDNLSEKPVEFTQDTEITKEEPIKVTKKEIKAPVKQEKVIEKQVPVENKIVVTKPEGKGNFLQRLVHRNDKPAPAATAPIKAKEDTKTVYKAADHKPRPGATLIALMDGDIEVRGNIIKPLQNKGITIRYKVDVPAEVKIVVYTKMGEQVKLIESCVQSRGVYEINWYGGNENGNVVADGIYIIYVKTGLVEKKIKAIVVK